MATPDHKALVRPSIPLDGTFSRLPSHLYVSADTDEVPLSSLRLKRMGIDIAVLVLEDMLAEGEALHRAVTLGLPTDASRWPLMGPHTMCFDETIHYLREYGRALGHE